MTGRGLSMTPMQVDAWEALHALIKISGTLLQGLDFQQLQPTLHCKRVCMLPLPTLLISADSSTVANDVRRQSMVSHLLKKCLCMLPLFTLPTSADSRAVADVVGLQIISAMALQDVPVLVAFADTFRKR